MPVYYLRTGSASSTTTVNLNSTNLWAAEISGFAPPATTIGTLSPSYTDINNEFVIDSSSGGVGTTTINSLPLTVTSNLTIANLSFGAKNTSTVVGTFTKAYLNISAGITLAITGTLQLNNGSMATGGSGGVGALRLNTNNTGKLSIQGNLNLGYHNLPSQALGTSGNANISVDGGVKSIIEFAGSSVCLIKVSSISGASTTAAYLTISVAANVGADPLSVVQIDFNKTTASNPAFVVSNVGSTGIRIWGAASGVPTFVTLNSNYDSATKLSSPNRYNAPGFLNFTIGGFSFNILTDTKELIFEALSFIVSELNYLVISNTISSFKVNNITNANTNSSGFLSISENSIIEINKNLILSGVGGLSTNIAGGIGVLRGGGTIKFVGTSNSILTLKSYTETEYKTFWRLVCFIDVNIEINKTAGSTLNISNNITDSFTSRLTLYKSSINTINITHTAGAIDCDQIYCLNTTSARLFNFIGNSTFNTTSKLVIATSSTNTAISINTTTLKLNEIEFRPAGTLTGGITPTANTYGAILTGDKGFTVNNFIHTNNEDNIAGRISSVILSNDLTAVYTVNNSITMLGLSNRRAILRGNISSVINLPSTSASSTTLTTTTSPALTTRHYISQSPSNSVLLRRTPSPTFTGSDITQQSSFAKINSGSANTWTLNFNVGTITARTFEAGIPAVFKYTGLLANLNINYVNTFDIDSSGAGTTTIKADNSYQNRLGIPFPNMWRTINWDALNPLLPNIIEGYVE